MNEINDFFESRFDCVLGPPQHYVELRNGKRYNYRTIVVMTQVDLGNKLDGLDSEEAAFERCTKRIITDWRNWLDEPSVVASKGSKLFWRFREKALHVSESDFETGALNVKVVFRIAIPELDHHRIWPFQHVEGAFIFKISRESQ